jgi:hypothetical protein
VVKPQRQNAYDWLYISKKEGSEHLIDRCLAQRSYNPREEDLLGGMAERTNALVLKTRGGETPVGSNPTTPALENCVGVLPISNSLKIVKIMETFAFWFCTLWVLSSNGDL